MFEYIFYTLPRKHSNDPSLPFFSSFLFFPAFRFELWGSFPMNPPKVWKTSWFYIKASKHYHITPLCPIFERSRHHTATFFFQINYITFRSSIHNSWNMQYYIKQNEKSCNISIYTSSLELLLINWSIFPITF